MRSIIVAISSTLILLSNSQFSYAGKEDCPEDSLHCAYPVGLANDLNDGRYIKLSNTKVSLVVCFNYQSLVFLQQRSAKSFLGPNEDQYAICSDAAGNHCQSLGVDQFQVNQMGTTYVANPRYYAIDLTTIKNAYPPCQLSPPQSINQAH